ncbi:glycosyl hydrolase family 28-related protein [Halomontanus rarus]|uniref:glycosyl hydrolase family 28-related protein n=1 Tax=Halomontanus rarus TaxID=3034020 RepID=UPI00293BFE80|nr:glycosyl hydrolase family 28-related protein [Halovivax sp. KZCA124]
MRDNDSHGEPEHSNGSSSDGGLLDGLTRRDALQMGGIAVGAGLLSGSAVATGNENESGGRGRGPIPSVYDVTKFGAKGDGDTDDSDAIQAAIDAAGGDGGGIVYLPVGTFDVDETLTVSDDHVAIVGAGKGTVIRATFEDGDVIYAGGTEPVDGVRNLTIRDLEITASVEKTSGAALFCEHGQRVLVENVYAERQGALDPNLHDAFYFRYFDSCVLSNVFAVCNHASVTIHGKEDQTWGAGFWIVNGSRLMNGPPNAVPEGSVGFHVGGSCGGIAIEDTDVIANERNLLVDTELSGALNRELFINQCWLDRSRGNGVEVGPNGVHLLHFNNTWLASSGHDDPDAGGYPEANNLYLDEGFPGRVILNGCRIFNAFGSGVVARAGQLTVSGCDVFHNGIGPDGGHGIALLGEVADTTVVGNTITHNGTDELGEGVRVGEDVDDYVVAANVIRENATEQLVDEGGPNGETGLNVT